MIIIRIIRTHAALTKEGHYSRYFSENHQFYNVEEGHSHWLITIDYKTYYVPKEYCEVVEIREEEKTPEVVKEQIYLKKLTEKLIAKQNSIQKAIEQTIKDLDNDLVKSGQHIGDVWKK